MTALKSSRPNIILIITDQQRYDTIAALGFDYMTTPNLDRLVNEGVSFDQCHVTAASCAPSRASLFTGMYPHSTGVLKNADAWKRSWVEDLNKSGYHCVNIGKMHTWPFTTPMGFHERHVVENKDRFLEGRYYFDEWDKALQSRGLVKQQRELYREYDDYKKSMGAFEWELPDDMHSDIFVGDRACWWLENYPKAEPLFLQIGFPGPHPPYDPTKRFLDEYIDKELPLLPVSQEELDSQPPAYKELRRHNAEVDHDSVVHLLEPTEAQRHRQRAHYLANVSMIDEQVGNIMDTLEKQGYLENSVIMFTSDHGDCMTDHGHIQKWTMYEQVTRVPLLVWSSKHITGGKRIEGLCQLMDIGPTVLEMAGLEKPDWMEAHSLLPALGSASEKWTPREYVFAEQVKDGNLTGAEFVTMVRGVRWKLVHFLDEPFGQLFDLDQDPHENTNLWDDPQRAETKRHLLDVLREWRIRSAIQTQDYFAANR
ncbi:MAG: sulfatase-like hydrolase/transferase [Opitutales bacterium]|jgi:arylsulfatase|nr:sulfatase-like hydrolase/transferase [Opitutales bacterium]MBT6768932.1 sulfatase-like hydrolase/transferase [Opitutales bacterium]